MRTISSAIANWRSTGSTVLMPLYLSDLATAYANNGQFDEAWRTIDEALLAIKATTETLYEAEVLRIAGEIAQLSLEPDAAKAETYFERALKR